MFFKLVRKNGRKMRRENSIFFVSLIVAVIAFYIFLSLENQDVIIFLKSMESDAVGKLLALLPVFYGVSLFLLFFLVYFSGLYQLGRRKYEFGVYLMLGMKRSRLFLLLLAEDIWNSLTSLLIGIPVAVFLSEMISLITSKVVGLGIIGHHFSFSFEAVLLTAAGFAGIKLVCFRHSKREDGTPGDPVLLPGGRGNGAKDRRAGQYPSSGRRHLMSGRSLCPCHLRRCMV